MCGTNGRADGIRKLYIVQGSLINVASVIGAKTEVFNMLEVEVKALVKWQKTAIKDTSRVFESETLDNFVTYYHEQCPQLKVILFLSSLLFDSLSARWEVSLQCVVNTRSHESQDDNPISNEPHQLALPTTETVSNTKYKHK